MKSSAAEKAVFNFVNNISLEGLTYYWINGQKYYRPEDVQWFLRNTAYRTWKKSK